MSRRILSAISVFSILFLSLAVNGQAFMAFMDKSTYLINETATIKYNQTSAVNLTGIVYTRGNSSDVQDNFTIENSSLGMAEYSYSQTLSSGLYTLNLTQGSENVKIDFGISSEILKPVVRIMGSEAYVHVDTSTVINNVTGPASVSGNFSDMLGLNNSGSMYYGYVGNLTGQGRYNFLLIDENVAGVYDTLYVDDDNDFLLFDDTEDNASQPFLETSERAGDMLSMDANNRFIVAEIDSSGGQRVLLIEPLSSPAFAAGDSLYLLSYVMDQDGNIKVNQTVNLTIHDDEKNVMDSQLVDIPETGTGNATFDLTGYNAGKYLIVANETPVDVFKVESFKLHGKVTDINGNPAMNFAPGSKVKIWVIVRDSSGNLMDLSSEPTGTIVFHDGTTTSGAISSVSDNTGVYVGVTGELTEVGDYKVVITGTDGSGNTENFVMGFKVQAMDMMVMAINPKYIDEGAGEGAMISAFSPGSNVSTGIFMLNMTKGSGLKSGGPPCGFDGTSCVRVTCNNSQFGVMVKDEFGNKYSLNSSQYSVMSIGQAAQSFGMEPPAEPGISDQCMVLMWGSENPWLNKTGNYKVEIKYDNSSIGTLNGGETISIQRLLASGSGVDFKGDSFSFFAPNSTVRVKLEIRNLMTDELLPASKILDARFTEMWKEWPERKNVFRDIAGFNKSQLNESMDGDKIVFNSPPEEGFYRAEFRFKANVSGEILEGTGNIFFELKKYMIWAELQSTSEDNWFVKTGENITLSVNIMDIDMGSMKGQQAASCSGCTGLLANISSLRNEQFFKEMEEGTDYTIVTGVVTNSTSGAEIMIYPQNLPPGWYGMDIELYMPGTTERYFGWGWFEIRNFFVDVFEVEDAGGGNYTRKGEMSMGAGSVTVPVGGSSLLGLAAFSPPSKMSPPMPLDISYVVRQGMNDERVWPPLPVSSADYSMTDMGDGNMTECFGGEHCETIGIRVINLSLSDSIKESTYMANFGVTTDSGKSDTGSSMVSVASYVVDYETVPQSKMYEFPPVYAISENLSLIFTASDFEGNDHNISRINVSELFSEKDGRPIKFRFGQNYTHNCTGSTAYCQIDVFLTGLNTGEYFLNLEIADDQGSKQRTEFGFEIKNLLFSVPTIYEGWSDDYSTPEKTMEAWYGDDMCDSQTWLNQNDECQMSGDNVVCTHINGTDTNLTVPQDKNPSMYAGERFCIDTMEGLRWRQMGQSQDTCPGDKWIYGVTNGTYVWINTTTDLSGSQWLQAGSTFTLDNYPSYTWEVVSLRTNEPYLRIKLSGKICGRNESGPGFVTVVPPSGHVNYSSFYHGPTYVVGDMWDQVDCSSDQYKYSLKCRMDIPDRPAYLYHNTTDVWLYPNVTGVNFTGPLAQGPVTAGGILNDGSGGMWKVISISKSKIITYGQNILSNGILVNTSLSNSGKFRVGRLKEEMMGFENKFSNQKQGIDLDGDGYKNSSLNFLIIDSANGYDKFIFSNYSQKYNFTDTTYLLDVNDADRANRQVGFSDTLTLLSIDPRASKVLFYDPNALGDFSELGDSKYGDNVTVPVIVKSPDGSPIVANVSITMLKLKTDTGMTMHPVKGIYNMIDGVGEIRINVSALGLPAGRYEFGVEAENDSFGSEKMNEWNWPRSTVRNFLVDNSAGYGGILTSFVPVDVKSYGGWDSQVKIRNLFTINQTEFPAMKGVMETIDNEIIQSSCPSFQDPADAGTDVDNKTYILERFEGKYYAYMTPANQSTVWISDGDCNFTTNTGTYSEGSPVNITLGQDLYMLYVLRANMSGGSSIGLSDFKDSIDPVRMDDWGGRPSPTWSMMSMNRSGTIYNVVFANDTGLQYPQAGTWGVNEVSKVVWIDTDGNFSDTSKYQIGDNFTAHEYVSRVGPGPWEGLIIADDTNINLSDLGGIRPGMDVRAQDNTPVYFGTADESEIGIDLNMNGVLTEGFAIVAYDDFSDGLQELTRIYVDDDTSISEPWWANSSNIQQGQVYTYYDFYQVEGHEIQEQEGSPPKGMWGGNIRFAPCNKSQNWEESADWNIKAYNGTNMILEKNVMNLGINKTISLTTKVFDFSQTPISGAEVELTKMMRFGGGQPFEELNAPGDFTLQNVQNVTDSNGYAMIKVTPPGEGWLDGAEYIASLKITYGGMTETVDNWFRVGQGGWM